MPSTMILDFLPNGSVEHTLGDKTLNTSVLGQRQIVRMSEVLFDADQQTFYVEWLTGPLANPAHCRCLPIRHAVDGFVRPGDPLWVDSQARWHACAVNRFETYEDAVAAEVASANYLRGLGYSLA